MPAAQGPIHVKRQATRRTVRKPPSGIFGPVGRGDAGLTRARRAAGQRTQRAQRKVYSRTVVPAIPKLARPTSRQRGAAASLVAQSLHRQGITSTGQVNALPAAQRQRVNRAKGYARTSAKYSAAQRALAAQPSLAQQARALAIASMRGLTPAAQARALGLSSIQAVTDARHPLAALNRQARTLGLSGIRNATLTGRADTLGRQGLERALAPKYWQSLAAQGEQMRTARGDRVAPGHHTRLQVAGFGPNVDLTSLAHTLSHATTLGKGDLGPRELLSNIASDAGGLGTAPFIGLYEAGAAAVEGLKKRPWLAAVPFAGLPIAAASSKRGQQLAKGVVQGYTHSVPGELLQGNLKAAEASAVHHPLYAALDLAAGAGVVGRTLGGVARAVGSTTEAAGLRGAAARFGSTVRSPVALNTDGGLAISERSVSRDSLRKGAQILQDRAREPLRDASGNVVHVTTRGRRMPVLKALPGEEELLHRRRIDHLASGTNAAERLAREEVQKGVHDTHRGGRVKGRLGRGAQAVVSLAIEKTIRPGHWTADVDKRIARLEEELKHPEQVYRHTGEVKKAREELAALRKARDISPEHQTRVFAAADKLIALRKAQDAEEIRLKTLDAAQARRAELMPYASSHMDARHFTVEEHAQLEGHARSVEKRARAAVDAAPAGSAERAQALADYRAAREHRIAVSGREPSGVRRHEDAQRQATRAEAAHARAQERLRKLENERNRLTGRQQVQRGPAAAQKMKAAAGAPTRAQAVLRHIDAAQVDERALARGASKEALREKVAGQLDRKLAAAREKVKATRQAAREARAQADSTSRPPAQAALRTAEGKHLPNSAIEEHMRAHGVDPNAVAQLTHREVGKGAFHRRFDVNTRPGQPGQRRTLHAFERGTSGHGHLQVEESAVGAATRINKAQSIDRFIHDNGLRHPAAGKAARGEALTPAEESVVAKGGGFTAHEAAETIDRLHNDQGKDYVAVRQHGAALDSRSMRDIQRMQSPQAFDDLSLKLLNDRILNPADLAAAGKSKARNVVLVPAQDIERLAAHMAPAGHVEQLFQMLNRPFRFSVLAQPRWLTGNFVEPYLVRLPVAGSGLTNVYGLGLDIAASRKIIRGMERSGDPAVRAEAARLRAQQHGGLFIGNRGASNRRTLIDSKYRALRVAGAIRDLPVMRQLGDLLQALPTQYFRVNRALIERWAQEASFGRQARKDIQEITGSWTQTVLLGRKALAEVQRGLIHTSTQERFMRAQHEMLGKYEGFSPTMRRFVQTAAPFLPWALSAARFVYWTMPIHHTIATSVLLKTEQVVDQSWKDAHKDAPASQFPGLQEDARTKDGGFTPGIRYTPYGLTAPITHGDLTGVSNEFLPQLSGVIGAISGKDPFGNDLKVKPTKGNPQGKARLGDKVLIALNQLFESTAGPIPSLVRRFEEHGATPYSNSFLLSPKTKPGTSHGMSGLNRALNPFRPTYVRAGSSSARLSPGSEASQILAGARGHVTLTPNVSEAQQILAGSRR